MLGGRKVATERLAYDTEPMTDEGIDLVAVIAAILTQWKIGLITFVLVAAAGLAYVRTLKPQFVATASFLPSQGHVEAANIASILNASGPGNLYLGLMRSRSVEDDVVERVHLRERYHVDSYEVGRNILASKSSFLDGPDGIITITIRDENAQAAADMANAYLVGLQDMSDKMAQAESKQSRRYLDRQLDQSRGELGEAEQNLLRLQEKTGQVAPESQAAQSIGIIAGLRSQLDGLQVQLAVQRQSEADGNPDIERLKLQIGQLQAQERRQEAGTAATPVGAAISAVDIPILNLQISHAQEIVTARRAAVTAMAAQAGSSHIDPSFSHPVFQIIDRAIPPESKAWPPPQQYQAAALGFAFVLALVAVLIALVLKRVWANPEHRANFRRLRHSF